MALLAEHIPRAMPVPLTNQFLGVFLLFPTTAGEQLEETLTRWGVNPQAWLVQLEQLDNRCTRALGAAHRMVQRAADEAQRWLHGIRLCREIFTDTDTSPPGARSDEFT